jgi:hypothetical protein
MSRFILSLVAAAVFVTAGYAAFGLALQPHAAGLKVIAVVTAHAHRRATAASGVVTGAFDGGS